MSNKWHNRFIELAKLVSTWSKDPRTGIGAVIVKDKRIIATGYNGFPSRIRDDDYRLSDRETKLRLTIHAEINAILQAGKYGVPLDDATLYIYGLPPCENCIKTILATNISEVIFKLDNNKKHSPEWQQQFDACRALLAEGGVSILEVM